MAAGPAREAPPPPLIGKAGRYTVFITPPRAPKPSETPSPHSASPAGKVAPLPGKVTHSPSPKPSESPWPQSASPSLAKVAPSPEKATHSPSPKPSESPRPRSASPSPGVSASPGKVAPLPEKATHSPSPKLSVSPRPRSASPSPGVSASPGKVAPLPEKATPSPPLVQVPPLQFEKPPAKSSESAFGFFWDAVCKVQDAHSSLDDYLADWFGLNQSKYQWALNDYYESNGKEKEGGKGGKSKEVVSKEQAV